MPAPNDQPCLFCGDERTCGCCGGRESNVVDIFTGINVSNSVEALDNEHHRAATVDLLNDLIERVETGQLTGMVAVLGVRGPTGPVDGVATAITGNVTDSVYVFLGGLDRAKHELNLRCDDMQAYEDEL